MNIMPGINLPVIDDKEDLVLELEKNKHDVRNWLYTLTELEQATIWVLYQTRQAINIQSIREFLITNTYNFYFGNLTPNSLKNFIQIEELTHALLTKQKDYTSKITKEITTKVKIPTDTMLSLSKIETRREFLTREEFISKYPLPSFRTIRECVFNLQYFNLVLSRASSSKKELGLYYLNPRARVVLEEYLNTTKP